MNFFKKLFNGKFTGSNNVDNNIADSCLDESSDSCLDESSKLIEEYEKIKSEISYLDSQYNTFVLKSFQEDLKVSEEDLKKGYKPPSTRWTSSGYDNITQEITFVKDGTGKYSYSSRIEIRFRCNSEFNKKFKILSAELGIANRIIRLDSKSFEPLVFKYIMILLIHSKSVEAHNTKKSFKTLVDTIGKATYRDSKIEDLLS